jgi:hypothetical protein
MGNRLAVIVALNGTMLLLAAVHMALGLWGTDACGLGGHSSHGGSYTSSGHIGRCLLMVGLPAALLITAAIGICAARRGSERLFAVVRLAGTP